MVTDLEIERLKRSGKLTPEEILKYALHDAQNHTANEPGEPMIKVMVLAVVETTTKRHKLVTYVSGFSSPAEQMGYLEAFRDKELRRWGEE